MFGTVADLLRLGRALLPRLQKTGTGGQMSRVLSQAAIERCREPQTQGIPQMPRMARSATSGRPSAGASLDRAGRRGPAAITHGGISGSRLWVDPERGLAFAFLTNLWAAPDDAASRSSRRSTGPWSYGPPPRRPRGSRWAR